MAKARRRILVTDLDNTLWDWVTIWHMPFSAMLAKLVELSGIEASVLEAEIRAVHQRYGTSEYAFLIGELPSLRAQHPNANLTDLYSEAIDVFRAARAEVLRAYPTVVPTLREIRARGARVLAYTESMAFYAAYRLRRTGIDQLIDILYSPPDHHLPAPPHELRKYPEEYYRIGTEHRHTPPGELKPNPHLLLTMLAQVGGTAADAVYVGDSLMKDMVMAQHAGVLDVHAAYGAAQHTQEYALLRRVSHWADEDIAREKAILAGPPPRAPTHILKSDFAELLQHVEFDSW
jgi:phosphoglycolate phosphatase